MRRLTITAFGLTVAAGFYLLLIDTVDPPELYAGCGAVLLAMLVFVASLGHGLPEPAIDPMWLRGSWRAAARVPIDIALVCREAIAQLFAPRPVRGAFRAVPFDAGGTHSLDVGRRALTEVLGSLAPNSIVLGIDRDRNLLLIHQLHRHGGREQLDVLGLG